MECGAFDSCIQPDICNACGACIWSAPEERTTMSKSPIEPAAPRAPRQPRTKPLDGVNLRDVMKARAEQDRVLKARLKQINSDIAKLMDEHDQISEILGIKQSEPREGAQQSDETPLLNTFTCADCGGHSGPNARGDCTDCGAGPFEQAR